MDKVSLGYHIVIYKLNVDNDNHVSGPVKPRQVEHM